MRAFSCWITAALVLVTTGAGAAEPAGWVSDSREAARRLGNQLIGELTRALETSPVEAIRVCRERAPLIAAEQGERAGARVGRTALRTRSSANEPLDWQRRALESFASRLEAGASPTSLEYTETAGSGEATERRWMKPIMTVPLCLQCHGHELAPGVAEVLAAEYPEDRAIGFRVGEMRGAFYVVWRGPTRQ